jgi:hypothetical protein
LAFKQASPVAMKDMELLIARKLELFPTDLRGIISAKIIQSGEKFRIEVSAEILD